MATRPRTGKPMTLLWGCQTSLMATAPMERHWEQGFLQVVAAVRDEKVDEMIQGDLSESRVVLAHDVVPDGVGWPVVHDGPVDGSVGVG